MGGQVFLCLIKQYVALLVCLNYNNIIILFLELSSYNFQLVGLIYFLKNSDSQPHM